MRPGFPVLGLMLLLVAGGCAPADRLVLFGPGERPVGPSAPVPAAPGTELAEAACLVEARRDFDVLGISSATPVTDASGLVVGRDVMVQVRRSGRTFDVRCRYDYAAGTARMMVL